MSLSETYGPDRFGLSFELYPPKTASGERALFDHLALLMKFRPAYITCTYGAGGSTQAKTLDIIQNVKQKFGIPVASHLTCVGATVDQLRDYLRMAGDCGVDHIVALRGDPPQGVDSFQVVDGGLRYAN